MQWQLAHFGLELGSGYNYVEQAIMSCNEWVDDIANIPSDSSSRIGSVLDNNLNVGKSDSVMKNTFGYIDLAIPIIRPECLHQVVEYSKEWKILRTMNNIGMYAAREDNQRIGGDSILSILRAHKKSTLIHGNQFIEHNVMAWPDEMMLTVLPIPSFGVCGTTDKHVSKMRVKLNKIVYFNNLLKTIMDDGIKDDKEIFGVNLSHMDVIDIFTWHIYTYMDNAMAGIASDPDLDRGVAQMLGTPIEDLTFEDRNKIDIAGTSLQRIVRGINMGESAIYVKSKTYRDNSSNLAFELSKQVAFNRIWKKSGRETNIIHIDSTGEAMRMENGVIDQYSWQLWEGYLKIPRDIVVCPRYAKRRMKSSTNHPTLDLVLSKLREIDSEYSISIPQHRALCYLYELLEGTAIREQQVVICDVQIDDIILRPLLKKLNTLSETGENICLILRDNYVENIGEYIYKTTPDNYRNLIIAITEIRERQQFDHKDEMFNHIKRNDLQLLSTYFEGFNRDEITRILGSSILAKNRIDVKYVRDYIIQILNEGFSPSKHIKPKQRKKYRKLTLEEIYDEANRRFVDTMNQENDSKENNSNLGNYILSNSDFPQTKGKSLYDSLKGMEPLIYWVKNKGKLFSPEAREYGFMEYPRGLLLTGVPGCGKTMAAKIIAEEWDMNLRRVKVDDIISKFVGQNEENMAKLLNELVENEPIICFVDEAEKLFTEMNTNHQNAATLSQNAVESMLLQFMEENDKRVFFIFTANDITKLSAPIIDRFDACFFVDLPTKEARSEIIQLMLEERKKGNLGLNYDALAEKSEKFTGRDIRSAIEESMMNAFSEDRELTQEDLEDVFEKAISTSDTHAGRITHLRELVKEGKIRSANTDYKTKAAPKARFDPNVA